MRDINPSPSLNLDLPKDYVVQRVNPQFIDSLEYNILKYDPRYPLNMQTPYGKIVAYLSEMNPEKLITMSSQLDPEIQRKGIARQLYKQAEIDTGRKIIPDRMLSDMSLPLHKKYGLGNEFGLSNYEEVIKEGLEKKAENQVKNFAGKIDTIGSPFSGYETVEIPPEWPPEFAKKEYDKLKNLFNRIGLEKFKSVAPTVLKGAGVAGAALAPSADAAATDILVPGGLSETAVSDERAIPDPKYQEYIRRMSQRKK